MSQSLGKIKGMKEHILSKEEKKVYYNQQDIYIGSFYGGVERGKCIQISTGDEHVQLTKKDVTDLVLILNKFLEE